MTQKDSYKKMNGDGHNVQQQQQRVNARFILSRNGGPPVLFELHAGQSVHIGRASSSDIVVSSPKVSGHHAELVVQFDDKYLPRLCVRDTSTNSTGVRDSADAEFEELNWGDPRPLSHGAEILVPYRTVVDTTNAEPHKKGEQVRLIIQYPSVSDCSTSIPVNGNQHQLPDAWNPNNGLGRWKYCECLGEGGLGIVYRAYDMVGSLGTVAVKVAKWADKSHGSRAPREAWQVYTLHREAQWSRQVLHQVDNPKYNTELASLFVRYLEDHTGFPTYDAPQEFDAVRALYEKPDLDWNSISFDPPLPMAPYVVMELAIGQPLMMIKPEETLNAYERCAIAHQAARALGYLGRFGLIHRDFRTSNIHVAGRGEWCLIKVLDLGLVITTEGSHVMNPNTAVKANWNRRQRQYDWVPPEVKIKPFPNFALPAHSFDVFSLGVLMLRLHGGKQWARAALRAMEDSSFDSYWRGRLQERGLDTRLLERILSKPEQRPQPSSIVTKISLELSVLPGIGSHGSHRGTQQAKKVELATHVNGGNPIVEPLGAELPVVEMCTAEPCPADPPPKPASSGVAATVSWMSNIDTSAVGLAFTAKAACLGCTAKAPAVPPPPPPGTPPVAPPPSAAATAAAAAVVATATAIAATQQRRVLGPSFALQSSPRGQQQPDAGSHQRGRGSNRSRSRSVANHSPTGSDHDKGNEYRRRQKQEERRKRWQHALDKMQIS